MINQVVDNWPIEFLTFEKKWENWMLVAWVDYLLVTFEKLLHDSKYRKVPTSLQARMKGNRQI